MKTGFMEERPNNTVIEMASVGALKQALTRTMVAVPAIPDTDDKVPSWDGEIRLYSTTGNFSNDTLVGRIPVQVKGRTVEHFSGKRAKFQVDINDLRNYKKDRGVMFFLIQSKSFDEYRIYYASLLPFDLSKILYGMGKKKTKKIELEVFPYKFKNGIIKILSDFLENRERQGSLVEGVFSIQDLEKAPVQIERYEFLVPSESADSKEALMEDLLSNPKYVYARLSGVNILLVVDKIQVERIVEARNLPIEVNGEVLYDKIQEINSHDESKKYQLGNGIIIKAGENKLTYNFTFNGTLDEQIREMKFMLALLSHQEIKIGKEIVQTGDIDDSSGHSLTEVQGRLDELLLVKRTLQQLHVKKDLKLGELSEKELRWLSFLVTGILKGQAVPLSINGQAGVGKLTIGNLTLIIASKVNSEGEGYIIRDFFAEEGLSYALKGMDFKDGIIISPYMILTVDAYKTYDNIDLTEIMPSIKKYECTELFVDKAILLGLELLKIYDECHNTEALKTALELFEYLQQNDSSRPEVYQLNRLQTEKRSRCLTKEEMQYLMTLKEPSIPLQFRLAASILLESFKEAQIIYDEMPENEREEFDTYPIRNLWKNK